MFKRILPILVIVGVGLFGIKALFAPDFFTSHDGPAHLSRLAQYIELLKDGQLPPRWSGTLNGRLGYPIFVYSYHLPFALGAGFYFLGANLHQAIELVLGATYVLSGLLMYLFLRESFGRLASVTGAVFYLFAPYRFSLLFVRAAIGETTAMMFLPLVLWAILKYRQGRGRKYLAYAGFSLAGAITAHSLFLPMYVPMIALYALLVGKPKKIAWGKTIKVVTLGLVISAFYLLPLIFERKYVAFDEVYSNQATSHLVTWEQLWHSPWGYGFSFPESDHDDMSFQLGLAQIGVVGVATLLMLVKRKSTRQDYFFLIIMAGAVLLMLESVWVRWIWQNVPGLKVIDFPWRFLGMTTLAAAYLAAYVVHKLPAKVLVASGLVTAVLFANRNHLRVNLPLVVDEQEVWKDVGTTAYANEFKPIWRATSNRDTFPLRVTSEGPGEEWELVSSKSNLIEFTTNFAEPTTMQINSIYFPGWRVYKKVDDSWEEIEQGQGWIVVDKKMDLEQGTELVGTIRLTAGTGKQHYRLRFTETPLRKSADYLSVAGIAISGWLVYSGNKLTDRKKTKGKHK